MSRSVALLLVTLAACGDDGGSPKIDAGMADARVFDAPAPHCDYTEMSDLTNDTSSGGTTEPTGITFTAATVICGVLDHTHFDGGITVDADSYTLTVAADTDIIVRLIAPGAGAIELVGLDIYPATGTSPIAVMNYYGNHGVVSARVPAGTFELLPFALASEAILASVPYRIEITADTPDARCPEITTGGYMENNDGPQDDGNDVLAYPSSAPTALTTNAADAPEPTNIVLAPDVSIRLYGESADINMPDRYEDTDTYEIATGAGTNELTVRLTWPTTGTNLDWILYEKNTTVGVGYGISTSTDGELKLTAVKPNTTYWLAISGAAGTTVPADYNATLCPSQYP